MKRFIYLGYFADNMELGQLNNEKFPYSSIDEGVELLSIEFPNEKEAVNFLSRLTNKNDEYGPSRKIF